MKLFMSHAAGRLLHLALIQRRVNGTEKAIIFSKRCNLFELMDF